MPSAFQKPLRSRSPNLNWGTQSDLIADLGQGNGPVAVMLTCAELGAMPDMLSHAAGDDLWIVQTAAAAVPPPGKRQGSAAASVCFALGIPTVRHLIVCSHADCRMLGAMMQPGAFGGAVSSTMQSSRMADSRVCSIAALPRTDDRSSVRHVMQQFKHLQCYPEVRERLHAGSLQLHGWIVDRTTSRVSSVI